MVESSDTDESRPISAERGVVSGVHSVADAKARAERSRQGRSGVAAVEGVEGVHAKSPAVTTRARE